MNNRDAVLVLEDGRRFAGHGLGAEGSGLGEAVFNTSMTGYQEILSDPSYCRQIVVFTAAHIGNYGVCALDDQSGQTHLSGAVFRDVTARASSHRAEASLESWLTRRGIVGISGVDTRALTLHIREKGAMRAGIFSPASVSGDALAEVQASAGLVGRDLASLVSTKEPYRVEPQGTVAHEVVLVDFGVKRGIMDNLTARGLAVQVVAASTSADEIRARKPAGVVLSNGPGDPAAVEAGIRTAAGLIGELPVLGICLGYQILALALGAKTFKLRFGHHGGNHPVRDERNGQVWISAQNHGFAVDPDSLPGDDVQTTHRSLYDGTLEGFVSPGRRLLAVQFHPEGCPGPSDANAVFDGFVDLLR